MAGATSRLLIPYMQGTDPLANLDAITQGIAEAVDDRLAGACASGRASCVVTAANTDLLVAVAFPAGRFPIGSTPRVVATPAVSALANYPFVGITSVSDTGFNLNFRRASTANFSVDWVALLEE